VGDHSISIQIKGLICWNSKTNYQQLCFSLCTPVENHVKNKDENNKIPVDDSLHIISQLCLI